MSTKVLGISAFFHDSAAALVEDGRIVAAAEEERFSRKKHDPGFPIQAINYCLEEGVIEVEDLDAIVYYDNPILTWDRVVKSCIATGEQSRTQFEKAARSVLGTKVWVQSFVHRALGGLGKARKLLTTEHHVSHAASAFYPSPFEEAAILTIDGVGEWATTTLGVGRRNAIELSLEIDYPHSLGLLYSAFTYFCGFGVNSGEYKLMGLAPYGQPVYAPVILDELISVKPDGSYRLDTSYFGYLHGHEMTNEKFASLFAGPRRVPDSKITRREMDLAASIQAVLEEVVVRIVRHARKETGAKRLVMAGGVALNCVANGKILRAGVFDDLWIQPASGDAGGAVGAALFVSHTHFDVPRRIHPGRRDGQLGSYLGPAFTGSEARAFLDRHALPYEVARDEAEKVTLVAEALSRGKIVGYFQGRMEFGPRALGARSILGDPRDARMQSLMNLKIKFRESFRPFAPAVLWDRVSDYFELEHQSPYMLLVSRIRENRRLPAPRLELGADDDMIPIIQAVRSDLPAITHVDYTARVQTVHPDDSPGFYALLKAFEAKTGCGVLVNTSFNVRGEPIVCSPSDAYACFMRTDIDLLVIEDCLVWKSEQLAANRGNDLGLPQEVHSAHGEFEEERRELLEALQVFQELRGSDGGAGPQGSSDLDRAIDDLFRKTVLSFRETIAGSPFAPMSSEPELSTYYIRRQNLTIDPDALNVAAYEDVVGLARALRTIWSREPTVALCDLADDHARVAHLLARDAPTLPGEVSSSLYVMF